MTLETLRELSESKTRVNFQFYHVFILFHFHIYLDNKEKYRISAGIQILYICFFPPLMWNDTIKLNSNIKCRCSLPISRLSLNSRVKVLNDNLKKTHTHTVDHSTQYVRSKGKFYHHVILFIVFVLLNQFILSSY